MTCVKYQGSYAGIRMFAYQNLSYVVGSGRDLFLPSEMLIFCSSFLLAFSCSCMDTHRKKVAQACSAKIFRGASGIGEAVEPENGDRLTESSDEEDSPKKIQCRPCDLCRQNVSPSELLRHLEQVHSISRDMVESVPNRRELRHWQTKQVLFKW